MIQIENLVKTFGGKIPVKAVRNVSLSATPGRIFGLLGPNGAGKTTLLRMVATLLKPDAGRIEVSGFDVASDGENARASLGFLTGATSLYDRLTPRETLTYFGRLQGMSEAAIDKRLLEITPRLKMDSFIDQRVGKCSTGQKQKCSIARALFHDPKVVILDEPTSGLDVLAARSVVGFIRQCAEEGRTVLFSTHILSEAQTLCHDLAFLHEGQVALQGSRQDIEEQHGTTDLNQIFLSSVGESENDEA
jgi:sodium transport system ATP-binding protein